MSYVDDADFNPYAAPKAGAGAAGQVAYAELDRGVEYAGFWVRFVALFIDSIILGLVGLVTMLAIMVPMIALDLNPLVAQLIATMVSWIIQICYYPLMHSSEKQATFGKQAMGLKVTDLYGRRISFGRALGREFAKVLSALIFMIGYLMAAFTERKQSLHDMIAGTVVIRSH